MDVGKILCWMMCLRPFIHKAPRPIKVPLWIAERFLLLILIPLFNKEARKAGLA